MSKKSSILTLVIAIAAICLSIASLCVTASRSEGQEPQDVQYVMYLGTNDKDTNEPVCSDIFPKGPPS